MRMFDEIWLNGEILRLEAARLAPTSAGALYGWGVFTTIGIARGRPLALDHHWERLEAHAARARVPFDWPRDAIATGLAALVERARVDDGVARVTVLRGSAGLWQVASGRESDVAIFVGARPHPSRDPLALTVSPYRINSGSPLAGVKTTAYVERLAALDEARGRGFAEAIVLNERGEVAEATAASLFWVRRDELATPSLATGCLAGVMRRLVLEAASRLKIRAVEGSFPLSDLHDADELFLTNCGRGIVSAAELDIHRYEPAPGPVALRLATAVAELLDGERTISSDPRPPSVE